MASLWTILTQQCANVLIGVTLLGVLRMATNWKWIPAITEIQTYEAVTSLIAACIVTLGIFLANIAWRSLR